MSSRHCQHVLWLIESALDACRSRRDIGLTGDAAQEPEPYQISGHSNPGGSPYVLLQELEAFGLELADFAPTEIVNLIAARLPPALAEALRSSFANPVPPDAVRSADVPESVESVDKIQIGPLDVP